LYLPSGVCALLIIASSLTAIGIPRLDSGVKLCFPSVSARNDAREETLMELRNVWPRLSAALAVLCLTLASAAYAADPPKHFRGVVTSVKDGVASIKSVTGKSTDLALNDKTMLFSTTAADLTAITPNRFVGVTSVEMDGKRVAREVHVFDESLRGLGEGHYPWDLDEGPNMMTNANIGKVESVGDDRVLKLDYKGGEQMVAVPPTASIVLFSTAPKGALKEGDKVFAMASPGADGRLDAIAFVIGANGQKPPM